MKYFYLGDDFMPGYVTHYIFGRDMYEKLNESGFEKQFI